MKHRHLLTAILVLGVLSLVSYPFIAHEGEVVEFDVHLGEFFFQQHDAEENAPITVHAGQTYIITFENEGSVEHEVHIGHEPNEELTGFEHNMFGSMLGLHLDPGETGKLHIRFTDDMIGEWEIACFMPGHYQGGQVAKFIVEAEEE